MPLRLALSFAMLAGILLAALLTLRQGLFAVAGVVANVGWGLALIMLLHGCQIVMSALAWRAALGDEGPDIHLARLSAIRWIRESINSLLPMAHLGGKVVAIRLLVLRGVAIENATASLIVDVTYEAGTQGVFALAGMLLYLSGVQRTPSDIWIILGGLMFLPMVGALILAQRRGFFHHLEQWLNAIAARAPQLFTGRMTGLHHAIQQLYRHPWRPVAGCCWHMLSWAAGTLEVWIILHFAGARADLTTAFILESLGQAVRSTAFIIPGAFGVQEGGYLLLGQLFGLAPEVGLGLSLAKRVRELGEGLLGLLCWQAYEGRRLLTRRPAPRPL